jgi:hypothetical protein
MRAGRVESDRIGSSESGKDLEVADSRPREIADFRLSPASTRFRERVVVLILLVVGWGVQSFVVATRRIPASSDQAIVGLMAKHILERGEHPVFYYGSAYAGSLEPHYVAGVFALLGPTPTAYRIAMGGLVLLMMLGTWAVTRRAFGPLPAILALAYLAVPPFFFLYKGLTSDGHYDAFNLFTLGVLSLCLRIDNRLGAGGDPGALSFLLLGVLFGVGWWINPITPAISAAALFWLFLRRRDRPSIRHTPVVAAGFLLGSLPWTWWNLRHEWASLASPELGSVGIAGALHNLGEIVLHSLPLLAGGTRFRIAAGWETFPFSTILVMLVFVVLLVPGVLRMLRGDRVVRLFFLCFVVLVVTVIWSRRYVPSEPRVLFPYYVLIPPVLAAGMSWIATRGSGGRWLAVVLGGSLLFAHASGIAVEYRHVQNTDTEATAGLEDLQKVLTREGVRHVYTDYWTAYRLSFESNEKIVAAPIPGDEAVRYGPYQDEVAGDPSAAIVVRGPRARCLESHLRERRLPYRRAFVPPFSAFTRLPPDVLRFVGERGGLPLPAEAYRVTWKIGPHPAAIPRGGTARVTVSFRNVSACSWPHAVHLGYHWIPRDAGVPQVWDGGRELPDRRIEPDQFVTLPVHLKAPDAPGRYSLVYDLVFEGVEWFAARGGAAASVPIDVR